MALLSEQGIINNVYDPTSQALRTTTNIVLSGVELSLNSAVEIKDADTDTRAKVKSSGGENALLVTLNAIPNGSVTVNRGADALLISGTSVVTGSVSLTGTSTVLANQGSRGADAWPVSGIVVNSPFVVNFTDVTSGITNVQGLSATTNLRLMGYSATETAVSPAAAQIILRHGTTNASPTIAYIKLAANESVRDWFGDRGLAVPNGVLVDRNAVGNSQITLYHKTEA